MLAELDMLKEPSYRGSDDGDGESFNGSPTGSINLVSLPLFFMRYGLTFFMWRCLETLYPPVVFVGLC